MKTISATRARADFYDLVERVSKKGKRIGITNKGETKAILISLEELESIEETLDILSDPNALKELRQAEEDIKKGRLYDWEDVKKELGLNVSDKTNSKSKKRTVKVVKTAQKGNVSSYRGY